MIDILLHVGVMVLVMAAAIPSATPLPTVWFLYLVLAAFWWVREINQDWQKHRALRSPWDWGGQKFWEALAPTIAGLLCAIGITVWRLS